MKVLLVPDSIHWATGSIARAIAASDPRLETTLCSAPVLARLLERDPELPCRVDLVHFLTPGGPTGLIEALHSVLPTVTSIHHSVDGSRLPRPLGDASMVGARYWLDRLGRRGVVPPERLFLVPYGVDTELFRPPTAGERSAARAAADLPAGTFVVGFSGKQNSNEADRKGVDTLIAALTATVRQLPGLRFALLGPGWGRLVERLRSGGVATDWTPFLLDRSSVARWYHGLDTYWVTSRVEGGPLPLLEAMASAVACVTTEVGVVPELGDDPPVVERVPIGDAGALADATLRLAADLDRRQRIGRAARAEMVEHRRVERTAASVAPLYAAALEHGRARLGIASSPDLGSTPAAASVETPGTTELAAVPERLRPWVRMQEHLVWLERAELYDRRSVGRLCWRAWRQNPTSLDPLSRWTRAIAPRLHRTLVAVKRGWPVAGGPLT